MLANDVDQYVGRSLLHYGEFSRGEAEIFEAVVQPGWRVADVGANIGAHTLVFSRLVSQEGAVFAFEPQRLIFQMLCANLALNNVQNVFAYQVAIGSASATVGLHSLDMTRPNNFGAAEIHALEGGGEKTQIVPLEEPCNFIKIDVEGMELEVLRGAEAMIKECRPVMYVENDRDDKSAALIDKIRSLGYVPRWHITMLFNPKNVRGNRENLWDGVASFNMLCLPEDCHGFESLPVADCSHKQFIARMQGGG